MIHRMIIAFIFSSMLCAAQTSLVVSASGSGTACSSGLPCSPETAISQYPNNTGGTITFKAGDYNRSVQGCSGWSAVLCINKGGASAGTMLRVTCDTQWSVPSSAGCKVHNGSEITGVAILGSFVQFDGFDYGGGASANQGIQVVCGGSSGNCTAGNTVYVVNNYVHDMSQSANTGFGTGCPQGAGIEVNNSHGRLMTGSRVLRNRTYNIGLQSLQRRTGGAGCNVDHGIYVDSPGALVQDNVVLDSVGYGIQYYDAPGQAAIANNTVVRSGESSLVLAGGQFTPGNATVINNIFDLSGRWGVQLGTVGGTDPCSGSHPNLVANNLFSGNPSGQVGQAASCTTVSGSRSEAPSATFVSYPGNSTDDYHLRAGSQAIANGTTSCVSGGTCPANPSTDRDGVAMSSPPAIGAYTLGAGASPPGAPTSLTVTVN